MNNAIANPDGLRQALEKKMDFENGLDIVKEDITEYLVLKKMTEFFKVDWAKLHKEFDVPRSGRGVKVNR